MRFLRGSKAVCALLVLAVHLPLIVSAQQTPNVPEQYKRLFFYYADQRSLYEKALNSISLTSIPVGRSYALIAGVTQYLNFSLVEKNLKPAAVDIEKLKSYLKDQEFFDEIVVLKDGDMNLDNLNYFLQNYFPDRLRKSPHSRFLFAYSGHGYAEGAEETARGFLLLSAATSTSDPINRIDLSVLRALLDPDIENAEKVLVLVNACHSGSFLGRKPFGPPNPLGPGDRGAHAIMASRTNQQSFGQMAAVGPGSVFFEKIFAGLEGAADNSPRDGVVTYRELDTYLHLEIPYATSGNQTPMEGDISRNGSVGEFFFLNRSRQVKAGNVKPWNPGNAVTFGTQASDVFEQGQSAFRGKRYEEALRAYRQAARAGNADAMTAVGVLYERGYGVAQDYQQARQWYEKGAMNGSGYAMEYVGNLYLHGLGVAQDYRQARQWYEKAAAAGNVGVGNSLASMYFDGQGVTQDYQQARQWFEKAAAAGNTYAMSGIGLLYFNGLGVAQDYRQARQWFEKAADSGNSDAMASLGVLYWGGNGVTQDYKQARQWFEKAAAAGSGLGMANIGKLYEGGCGVPQDYQLAREWYEKAAATCTPDWNPPGCAVALYYIGNMYEEGLGVKRDNQQARQWYQKAAAEGNLDAIERLKKLPE